MTEINASNEGKTFTLTPAGNFAARCYSMVHIGTIMEKYMGESKLLNKVRITWELPTELHVFNEEKGEQPFSISKEFTLSLHEKATLRKFLESWRGQSFTDEQAKKFNISLLVGVPCMLNIIHKIAEKSGNKYADIASVSAMPKGYECPKAINLPLVFSIKAPDWEIYNTLPDFLKDKIKSSLEYKELQLPGAIETPSENVQEDNDLPF